MAAAAGAAASRAGGGLPPWKRVVAALGLVPVGITFSELVGSCMFVDGRSMQPTLNPAHDGWVGLWACVVNWTRPSPSSVSLRLLYPPSIDRSTALSHPTTSHHITPHTHT